jgi:malate/lactate dehydrogenase
MLKNEETRWLAWDEQKCQIPVREFVSMVKRTNFDIIVCVWRNPVSFMVSYKIETR